MVAVVGLGTQDSEQQAVDFVNEFQIESAMMLWDRGFSSWAHYRIAGQPAAILVGPRGEPIAGWQGGFPPDQVLELVEAQ